ncbi:MULTISPECIES: hypothetical protein [Vibrio]|uniref:hypothetical protein n=1 Tax=Vibrio TaxID=662 RepID=UPI001483932C|nr:MULTISPECIES: hypothetical protein [Vibrio]MBY7667248.1 hypothetical protein [Vibrio anguillarum]MDQ2190592.1 hypothetical protein [Vibrio sp. A14(2019)]MDQ2196800.1 hypothetical protein [Vibrio sp. 2017_1457_11]NNN75357.1 hypothetical protein [Vibrio sp. B7]NNN92068.1 hypothetical protein [Vibrio sp. B8-1]
MLNIAPEAKTLVQTIVTYSRYGVVEPHIIARLHPEHSEHHIAFVLEQLAQQPFPDLQQLTKTTRNTVYKHS